MRYCANCGQLNEDSSKFCTACGTPMYPASINNIQPQFQQPIYPVKPQSKPIYKKPWFIILCAVWILFILFILSTVRIKDTESDSAINVAASSAVSSETTTLETTTEEITEPPTEAPKDFLGELSTVLEPAVAEKAYRILTNDIGFEDLEYDGVVSEGLTNYRIIADGYNVILTASDDVYRIFSGDCVFYENGTVTLTKSQLKDREISSSDSNKYYAIAKEIVSQNLNNPKSAEFPSSVTKDGVGMERKGDLVAVSGWVYAENGFGATIQNDWIVQFTVMDLDSYAYNIEYIQIGSDSVGQYIDFGE